MTPPPLARVLVYPVGLAAWLLLSRWPGLPGAKSVDPEPQYRRLAVQVDH
jgi:hypothetical protein